MAFHELPPPEELLEYINRINNPLRDYVEADRYIDKLRILRNYYLQNEHLIFKNSGKYFASYPVNWADLFTPIEMLAWSAIRGKGKIILYPQYPVLHYFVDFGNPVKRIALELDGKQFHNTDKDRKRDNELRAHGWTVYRITGSEMSRTNFKDYIDCTEEGMYEDEMYEHLRYWILNTGDGVIEALSAVHFRAGEFYYPDYCDALFHETLENHKLVH
jgi:very-short-patch-repair endonuclease